MTTALFLGRFQPPHVGHVLTIRSLLATFDKLIVGVTECEPSIMTTSSVISIMEKLIPDSKVSFLAVPGSVEGGTAKIDCDFDVCCSGNPAVLSIMAGKGYKTKYTERSLDHIFSGTRERGDLLENALHARLQDRDDVLYEFRLVKVSSLRPIEKLHAKHFLGVEKQIVEAGVMLRPLIVDKHTHAILDGSHRYGFLLKHGYQIAPALLCDYDDESIFVGTHLAHRFEFDNQKWITKQHVRATAVSGQLYEPRTTRHFFPFRKVDIPTELSDLGPKEERCIDHLIANIDPDQELHSNRGYITEIEQELAVLASYRKEQLATMRWLEDQNEFIKGAI